MAARLALSMKRTHVLGTVQMSALTGAEMVLWIQLEHTPKHAMMAISHLVMGAAMDALWRMNTHAVVLRHLRALINAAMELVRL